MNPRTIAAYANLSIFTVIANAFGQERPIELKVLDRYVGDWTSDVTISPAVWNPAGTTLRTKSHGKLVLDCWFLCGIEVSHEIGSPKKISKSLFLRTYDSVSKKYVLWSFHSTGGMAKWTGSWNETKKSLTAMLSEPPSETTATLTESFPNDNTNNGTLVFTGSDGRTMFDMTWTRTRQKPLAKNPLRQEWSKIGTPIDPIPKEMKRLEPLVGTWDAKYVFRLPQRREEKGVITDEWALDGRFVLRRETVGDSHSIAIIGYDTNKRAYRLVRAVSNGKTNELLGEWDKKTRSIIWKAAGMPKGVTSISTWRFVGNDAIQLHVVREADSAVALDLTIKTERRKKQ